MQELIKSIEALQKKLRKKEAKKLQTRLLKRLIQKAIENNIDDEELSKRVKKLIDDIRSIWEGNMDLRKEYKNDLRLLIENIKRKYGWVPKDTYISMYVSLGLIIGTAIGTLLIYQNPIYISVGSGIGIVFGSIIGSLKEKEAEKEGKLY